MTSEHLLFVHSGIFCFATYGCCHTCLNIYHGTKLIFHILRKPAAKKGKVKETKVASKQKGKNRSMVMADSSDDEIQVVFCFVLIVIML